MSGFNLPDGVTQAMIDRAYGGENCGNPEHGETNRDGTCDACRDASPLDEPVMFDPEEMRAYWRERSDIQ